jgi:signal transduction histidine kinase
MDERPIRVLLVEDNPADARLIHEMLAEAEGIRFHLERADRLSAGLERLDAGGIDVILLDLSLPDSQGLETFARNNERAPQVPIIVLSGLSDQAVAVEAVRRGAQDYLMKGQVGSGLLARAIHYAIERKQVQEALRQRTADLEARNEDLDAFAHTVAHDIKDPLGLIVGYAYISQETSATLPGDEVRPHLEAIVQNALKIGEIIDALLLLAGVRKKEVKSEPLDMAHIVGEARQRLSRLIEDCEAEIILPDRWPPALGYAPWVEEVWVNYLSNAIKYGGQPPCVELGGTLQPDNMARFWVRDNGCGLSVEGQAVLFTPFTRLDQVPIDGHGLGLSIVRRIVERFGGQVGADSEVGRGSTFWFTLPAG